MCKNIHQWLISQKTNIIFRSYRRMRIFNYNLFKIYFIIIIILLYIFVYYNNNSCVLSKVKKSSDESSPSVMYVVRTVSKYYSIRLIHLLNTWISLVDEDVYFVSDKLILNMRPSHMIITEKTCGPTSHSVRSLCCQTIHDFILYRRYQNKYEWFCHFDDDQYVHINNLIDYLSKLNSNYPYYIGRSSWNTTVKRTKNPKPGHFWFATLGAGVCLSKRTIQLLEPYTRNISQFIDGCDNQHYPDDIYLGFIISNYLNISLTKNNRFHSHLERSLLGDKYTFMNTFHQQITFGFGLPRIVYNYLPNLYPRNVDPLKMRTIHCLLYTQSKDCQTRTQYYLFNLTQ